MDRTGAGIRMAVIGLVLSLLASGCAKEPAPPPPVPIDDEASGYYCGMLVLAHPGPKAQIWVAGRDGPLWFTSVRDAFAYLQGGEREGRLLAVYVQDMARAESWEHPGRDAFVPAGEAVYVWGSDRRGGMGAPELVPFADPAAARAFIAHHGGRILTFAEARRLPLLGMTPTSPSGRSGPGSERENQP